MSTYIEIGSRTFQSLSTTVCKTSRLLRHTLTTVVASQVQRGLDEEGALVRRPVRASGHARQGGHSG